MTEEKRVNRICETTRLFLRELKIDDFEAPFGIGSFLTHRL